MALEAVPAFEAGRALWAINVCVNSREILCLENATSSKLYDSDCTSKSCTLPW